MLKTVNVYSLTSVLESSDVPTQQHSNLESLAKDSTEKDIKLVMGTF